MNPLQQFYSEQDSTTSMTQFDNIWRGIINEQDLGAQYLGLVELAKQAGKVLPLSITDKPQEGNVADICYVAEGKTYNIGHFSKSTKTEQINSDNLNILSAQLTSWNRNDDTLPAHVMPELENILSKNPSILLLRDIGWNEKIYELLNEAGYDVYFTYFTTNFGNITAVKSGSGQVDRNGLKLLVDSAGQAGTWIYKPKGLIEETPPWVYSNLVMPIIFGNKEICLINTYISPFSNPDLRLDTIQKLLNEVENRLFLSIGNWSTKGAVMDAQIIPLLAGSGSKKRILPKAYEIMIASANIATRFGPEPLSLVENQLWLEWLEDSGFTTSDGLQTELQITKGIVNTRIDGLVSNIQHLVTSVSQSDSRNINHPTMETIIDPATLAFRELKTTDPENLQKTFRQYQENYYTFYRALFYLLMFACYPSQTLSLLFSSKK